MANNVYGVTFNGRRIVHPGAYDNIDASAMTVTTGGSLNIPIVVGTADAGQSGVVKWFTSSDEATSYLSGGDLVTATQLMFSPSPEGGGGASLIGVIVANETVQASLVSGGLTIKSLEFGDGGNRIQVKLEDGTVAGTKKFTAYRWDTNLLETYDNLGAAMKITYSGSEAYAVVDVTKDANGNAITLQTKIGADESTAVVDLNLDLTNTRFSTVDAIVSYINGVYNYSAEYVSYKNSLLESSKLNTITDVDILAGGYVLSDGDLEYQVNRYSELVSVEVMDAITNFTDYTYLTSGAKGSAPTSWATYFDTIKTHFSDILVVLDHNATIHAEALAHVGEMEQRNQRQVLFTGGFVGETPEMTKKRATALNSSRAVLAYPGIYYKAYDNGKTALPAYFTGAMIAGRVCGVDPSEPITFDYFNLVGLENSLIAGDPVIDDLITSGVAVLEQVQNGGIRLVEGITTYISSNNTLFRELSVRRGADTLAETMRSAMEQTFVGKKGLKATVSAVQTKAIDVLEQAIKDGLIVSYGGISVRFVDTVVYVDYEVAPVEPINFVLVSSHFVPSAGFTNGQ